MKQKFKIQMKPKNDKGLSIETAAIMQEKLHYKSEQSRH